MKQYLGDSVYVDVERGMLKLTTDNGLGPSNTIYLEDSVFRNLQRYRNQLAFVDEAKVIDATANEGETSDDN